MTEKNQEFTLIVAEDIDCLRLQFPDDIVCNSGTCLGTGVSPGEGGSDGK